MLPPLYLLLEDRLLGRVVEIGGERQVLVVEVDGVLEVADDLEVGGVLQERELECDFGPAGLHLLQLLLDAELFGGPHRDVLDERDELLQPHVDQCL